MRHYTARQQMIYSPFVSSKDPDIRAALSKLQRELIVKITKLPKKKKKDATTMKIATGPDYSRALSLFLLRLKGDQQTSYDKAGQEVTVQVFHETGRKFDKVYVGIEKKAANAVSQKTIGYTNYKVKYFIERSTGNIYGAKSPLAPNTRWWNGTIYTSHLWDWTGDKGGIPTHDTSVREVSTYGDYKHYEPVSNTPSQKLEEDNLVAV